MPAAGLSNGGGGRGGDLGFSMMSQCRSDAKHATLGAAACPLAKGNNLMHARKPAGAPEARTHARALSNDSANSRSGADTLKSRGRRSVALTPWADVQHLFQAASLVRAARRLLWLANGASLEKNDQAGTLGGGHSLLEVGPVLLELIAKSQLPALSGVAQKNYMNILERVVQKVLDDQQNVRPIKELLQMLYISLCALVQDMGKSVLVGNINVWVHRMENIMQWQQQLDNIQINRPSATGMMLTDLPASLQLNIMQHLSDGRDLVSLGQVSPELGLLTEDRLLWKKLCQYHFTDRQIRKRLMVSDKGHLEWKKMYFKLSRCYPHREQYSDTLHFCTHCHILFWKDTNHPCTANNTDSCTVPLYPQDFINLFNF